MPLIVFVSMVNLSVSRVLLAIVAVKAVKVGFSIGVVSVFVEVGSAFWGSSLGGFEIVDTVVKVVEAGVGLTVKVAVTCWLSDTLK